MWIEHENPGCLCCLGGQDVVRGRFKHGETPNLVARHWIHNGVGVVYLMDRNTFFPSCLQSWAMLGSQSFRIFEVDLLASIPCANTNAETESKHQCQSVDSY